MQTRRYFGKLLLGGVAAAVSARAADWTQWRGPKQDGISPETGLLQDWPAGGPKLVWDVTGVGNGYSSVATVGDRILTAGEVDGKSSVLCLNAKDGSKVWATAIGKTGTPGCCNAGGPRCTPTIDGAAGLVFGVSQYGEVAALNLKDGKEVWKKDTVGEFGARMPQWGFSSAPVVDGNQVLFTICSADGMVVALDKKSGKELWKSELKDASNDNAVYSTLVVATIEGVKQYIQLTDISIAGIDPTNGKTLWRADRPGKTAVIPTPVVFGNLVYTASGYQVGCSCFEVKKTGDRFEASEVWKNREMQNHHGGVIRIGPNVYGHSDFKGGVWTCQDIKTGNVLWQEKGIGKGSIAYADNRFILRAEGKLGTIALIEASPTGYKEHGRFDQPNRSGQQAWPHPVISNGKMYIRDEDHLLCYDVSAKA